MTANTAPIFTVTPKTAIGTAMTAANTAMDGTGTVQTLFTAGSNGSYVRKIILRALGTNVATVVRIFANNGGANSSASNNSLIAELSLPATTASNSAAQGSYEIPLEIPLQASYTLTMALGTAVSAGWIPTVVAGDY